MGTVKGLAGALLALTVITPVLAQSPRAEFDGGPQDPVQRIRLRQVERLDRQNQIRPNRLDRLDRERFRQRVRGDGVHLRLLRDYVLAEGETAAEPVVVIGGSARIDGHAEQDVVVIGGNLHLGPTAVVDGDVVAMGGGLTRDPGAAVYGAVDETRVGWPRIDINPDWGSAIWWPRASLWLSGIRMGFVLLLAAILTVVAPGWIATIAGRPAATSGLAGLAAEILFVPAVVVLVVVLAVSLVGIPLLLAMPLLFVAFAGLWVAGVAGVAVRIGSAIRGHAAIRASVGDLVLGYALIVSVTLIGQMLAGGLGWVSPVAWPIRSAGLVIEYVAWTIGLGAALTSLFAHRRGAPPPLPA